MGSGLNYYLIFSVIINKSSKLFIESEDPGCSPSYLPRKLKLSSNSMQLNFGPSYNRVELEWNVTWLNALLFTVMLSGREPNSSRTLFDHFHSQISHNKTQETELNFLSLLLAAFEACKRRLHPHLSFPGVVNR